MQQPGLRLRSIDALRGIAVVLMFLHHFPLYLMRGYQDSEVFSALFGISRFAAPLFLFIVGVSMVLSARRRIAQGGIREAARHITDRGLVLFASGFLLNMLIGKDPGTLNILHTIGLSMILLMPLAMSFRPRMLAASFLLFIALSMTAPDIPQVHDVLSLFDFPPLPWSAYTLFGIFFCHYMNRSLGNTRRLARHLEYAALVSMLCALLLILGGIRLDFDSDATAPFIALSMGLLLYASSLSFWVYEVYKKNPLLLRPFLVYGRCAFSIYFAHHIFVATIPALLGLRNSFSLGETAAFLAAFLVLSYAFYGRRPR